MYFRRKANFRKSHYSDYNEKTYSPWIRRNLDFIEFNKPNIAKINNDNNPLITAINYNFINKSGKQTNGLEKFYKGKQGKAENGLEISTLAIVDVDYNTAYNLSNRETPVSNQENETRVDQYIAHLQEDRAALPQSIRYLVADGYYSKTKFIEGVTALELEQIGKLRNDANLRWLYKGEPKSRRRPKCYDGKVNFDDLNRFELVDEIAAVKLYTAIVNNAHFKRDLRIVYLVKTVKRYKQHCYFLLTLNAKNIFL